MLHSINHDQKLYVLTCGNGYSCLGFEVAERKRVAVRKWLGLDASPGPSISRKDRPSA